MVANQNYLIYSTFWLLIQSTLSQSSDTNTSSSTQLVCQFDELPKRETVHRFNLVNMDGYARSFTFQVRSKDEHEQLNTMAQCSQSSNNQTNHRFSKRQNAPGGGGGGGGINDPFFQTFTTYDSLKKTLEDWGKQSQGWATFLPSIGKSSEGQDIFGMRITNPNLTKDKRSIWINGGLDGSQILIPSTAAYIIRALLYDSYYIEVADLLEKYEFHFTPMANPDGFEYAKKNNVYWRKNRRKNKDGSFGVDLTRNFDDHWGQVGCSNNPGAENYCGTGPNSEPETQALMNYASQMPRLFGGIDLNTNGQYILRAPNWSYIYTANNAVLKQLSDGVGVAFRQSGFQYTSYTGAEAFAPKSGTLLDWMELRNGMVSLAFNLSPPQKVGQVPQNMILRVSDSAYSGILQYSRYLSNRTNIPPNIMKPQGLVNLNPNQIFTLLGHGIGGLFGYGK